MVYKVIICSLTLIFWRFPTITQIFKFRVILKIFSKYMKEFCPSSNSHMAGSVGSKILGIGDWGLRWWCRSISTSPNIQGVIPNLDAKWKFSCVLPKVCHFRCFRYLYFKTFDHLIYIVIVATHIKCKYIFLFCHTNAIHRHHWLFNHIDKIHCEFRNENFSKFFSSSTGSVGPDTIGDWGWQADFKNVTLKKLPLLKYSHIFVCKAKKKTY